MRTTAVITTVIDALSEQGGSVGRDQIRYAVYLLIHAAGFRMDIGFDHVGADGIRSAELDETLASMRSDGLVERRLTASLQLVLGSTNAGHAIAGYYPKMTRHLEKRFRPIAKALDGASGKDALKLTLSWRRLRKTNVGHEAGSIDLRPIFGRRSQGEAIQKSADPEARARALIDALEKTGT